MKLFGLDLDGFFFFFLIGPLDIEGYLLGVIRRPSFYCELCLLLISSTWVFRMGVAVSKDA